MIGYVPFLLDVAQDAPWVLSSSSPFLFLNECQ
jgi:hypothetical protein